MENKKSPEKKAQKLEEYTEAKIKEIVETCVKSVYGGMESTKRRTKKQKPNTMIGKVLGNDITIVGLYCLLPNHLKKLVYSNDSKSKRMLKTDTEVRKELSAFILEYDSLYTKKFCCFLTERARMALKIVANGESTNYPLNFKTWFNVSERQLYKFKDE